MVFVYSGVTNFEQIEGKASVDQLPDNIPESKILFDASGHNHTGGSQGSLLTSACVQSGIMKFLARAVINTEVSSVDFTNLNLEPSYTLFINAIVRVSTNQDGGMIIKINDGSEPTLYTVHDLTSKIVHETVTGLIVPSHIDDWTGNATHKLQFQTVIKVTQTKNISVLSFFIRSDYTYDQFGKSYQVATSLMSNNIDTLSFYHTHCNILAGSEISIYIIQDE